MSMARREVNYCTGQPELFVTAIMGHEWGDTNDFIG